MAKIPRAPKTAAAPLPSLKPVEVTSGDTKAAMSALTAKARSVYQVPRTAIKVLPGFNLRLTDSPTYKAEIENLVDSILTRGFLSTKPLSGFVAKEGDNNVVYVTDGHRRLEAANIAAERGADVDLIPMIVKPGTTTAEDLEDSLYTENMAVGMSVLEKAIHVKRFYAMGLKEADVAKRMHVSGRYIRQLALLINAPKALRELVRLEKLDATKAIQLLEKHKDDSAAATAAAQEIVAAKEARIAEKEAAKAARQAAKDAGEEPPPVEKIKTVVTRFKADAGTSTKLTDLFADFLWFKPSKSGTVTIPEDVEIIVKVKRVSAPAPKGVNGKGKKAKDEPIGREVDPLTMADVEPDENEVDGDDFADNAPDLRDLGIADRADPAADL